MNATPGGRRLSSLMLVALLGVACGPGGSAGGLGGGAPVAETGAGTVRGVLEDGIRVFRGIPYAAPPVGALRWRPPRPAEAWEGVREARDFGRPCPQAGVSDAASEDCLFLNVWTPGDASTTSRLPVMVWVHGGGFRAGSGDDEATRGDAFARDGVVLVSFNYRLGALGFFAHPLLEEEQAGFPRANYGLLDMVAALEWVQQNVEAFGGDPRKVTIFGHSAGGMSVHLLMVVPETQGLFQRAIGMSGYGTWPLPRLAAMGSAAPPEGGPAATGQYAAAKGQYAAATDHYAAATDHHAAAEEIGLGIVARALEGAAAGSLDELRSIPADHLAEAVRGLHRPVVDGFVLPEEPGILFARGQQHDVPFISGGASYDGTVFPAAGMTTREYLDSWAPHLPELKGLYADDLAAGEDQAATRLFGDARYVLAGRTLVRSMATVSSPGWLYYYPFVPEVRRAEAPGAGHGTEIRPLFGHGADEAGQAVGGLMRAYWIQFARSGDPNGEGLPRWPAHDAESDLWLVFDERTEATSGVIRERLDFLEERYRQRVGPEPR